MLIDFLVFFFFFIVADFFFFFFFFFQAEDGIRDLTVTGVQTCALPIFGNDVVYGLAAGVWTQNIRRALTMAEKLQAGTVWINTYRAVSYLSPFGGYKRSGLGRESGQEMIKEYLQVKSVWISTATDVPNPFIQR